MTVGIQDIPHLEDLQIPLELRRQVCLRQVVPLLASGCLLGLINVSADVWAQRRCRTLILYAVLRVTMKTKLHCVRDSNQDGAMSPRQENWDKISSLTVMRGDGH